MIPLTPERFNYTENPFGNLRKNLEDYVDIYYFKTKMIHVLLQDPSLFSSVYRYIEEKFEEESKEHVQRLGLDEFFKNDFWKMSFPDQQRIIENVIEGNEGVMLKKLGIGIPDKIEFLRDNKAIRININESLESYNMPRLKRPICYFLSGLLAGINSGRFGDLVTYEEKCVAKGDRFCQFFIGPTTPYIGKMRNYLDLPFDRSSDLPGITKSMLRGTGEPDYTILLEHFVDTTLKAFQYMSGESRPELGKKFHVFLLQQHNLALLESSSEAHNTLKKAGKKAGKKIARIGDTSGITARELIAALPELLMRTGMGLVKLFRTKMGYRIEVKDCAESTGLEGGKKLCPFETGLFSGFFQHLDRTQIEGSETKCAVNNGHLCVHELERKGKGNPQLKEILEKY